MIYVNRYNQVYSSESNSATYGNLDITVIDITDNNPIANALVSIFKVNVIGLYGEQGEGIQIGRYLTDSNGKIPIITLPAVSSYDSKIGRPRIIYYLSINAFGYYDVVVMEIQIYPNITTSYNISLSPITTQTPRYEFIYNPAIPK